MLRKLPRWLWLVLGGLLLIWALQRLDPFALLGAWWPETEADRRVTQVLAASRRAAARALALRRAHARDSVLADSLRRVAAQAAAHGTAQLARGDSLQQAVDAARGLADTAAMVPLLEAQVAEYRGSAVALAIAFDAATSRATLWEHRAVAWRQEVTDSLGPLRASLAKELAAAQRREHRWRAVATVAAVALGIKGVADLAREQK